MHIKLLEELKIDIMTNEKKHDAFSERYGDSTLTFLSYRTYIDSIYDKGSEIKIILTRVYS